MPENSEKRATTLIRRFYWIVNSYFLSGLIYNITSVQEILPSDFLNSLYLPISTLGFEVSKKISESFPLVAILMLLSIYSYFIKTNSDGLSKYFAILSMAFYIFLIVAILLILLIFSNYRWDGF